MNDQNKPDNKDDKEFPGYPHYKPEDDIYRKEEELEDIDPETGQPQKAKPDDNIPGLDIPGAEDDDNQENVGSEDEENNYYSIGGENHEDLEENNDSFIEEQ